MNPEDVVARIDRQELVDLALALGNIDSPRGSEGPAGQFVYDWLRRAGFEPKKYGIVPERCTRCTAQPGSSARTSTETES